MYKKFSDFRFVTLPDPSPSLPLQTCWKYTSILIAKKNTGGIKQVNSKDLGMMSVVVSEEVL